MNEELMSKCISSLREIRQMLEDMNDGISRKRTGTDNGISANADVAIDIFDSENSPEDGADTARFGDQLIVEGDAILRSGGSREKIQQFMRKSTVYFERRFNGKLQSLREQAERIHGSVISGSGKSEIVSE